MDLQQFVESCKDTIEILNYLTSQEAPRNPQMASLVENVKGDLIKKAVQLHLTENLCELKMQIYDATMKAIIFLRDASRLDPKDSVTENEQDKKDDPSTTSKRQLSPASETIQNNPKKTKVNDYVGLWNNSANSTGK